LDNFELGRTGVITGGYIEEAKRRKLNTFAMDDLFQI
jgi:hypothetical protein